jgi:hypothetical protein
VLVGDANGKDERLSSFRSNIGLTKVAFIIAQTLIGVPSNYFKPYFIPAINIVNSTGSSL